MVRRIANYGRDKEDFEKSRHCNNRSRKARNRKYINIRRNFSRSRSPAFLLPQDRIKSPNIINPYTSNPNFNLPQYTTKSSPTTSNNSDKMHPYNSSFTNTISPEVIDTRIENISPNSSDAEDNSKILNHLLTIKQNPENFLHRPQYWEESEQSFVNGCRKFYRDSYSKIEAIFREDFVKLLEENHVLRAELKNKEETISGITMNKEDDLKSLEERIKALENQLRFVDEEKNMYKSDSIELKEENRKLCQKLEEYKKNEILSDLNENQILEELNNMEKAYIAEQERMKADHANEIKKLKEEIDNLRSKKV